MAITGSSGVTVLQNIGQQFINWTKKKIYHDCVELKKELYFKEREIWWAALGKNIGYEIDGKHSLFERPVLILKKYYKDTCFVLPLTTKIKNPAPWYQITIDLKNGPSAVNITQGRTISKKRLLRKMERLDSGTYENIVEAFINTFRKAK